MIKTPLSTVIGGAFWTPGATVIGGQQSFSQLIKKLFANGEQGFFYDPNDLSTLYQDAAGTIPVTAAGQPVGLMLDKSKPITNISILDSAFLLADGWIRSNPEISVTNVDGSLRVSKGVADPKSVYKPFSCESGKLYRLTVKYKNHTGNNVRFFVRNTSGTGLNPVLAQNIQTFTATDGVDSTFFISNSNEHSIAIDSQNALESSVDVESISITKVSDSTNHAYQTVSASRPILQRNATTGAYYLAFDGVDDFLQTNSIDFTTTDKVSLFAGVRKLSDANTGVVCELGMGTTNYNGFSLFAPSATGANKFDLRNTAASFGATTVDPKYNAPVSSVFGGYVTPNSANKASLRVNGAVLGTTSEGASGNIVNSNVYIGRRGGTSLPFNGHLYSLIGIGRLTTDSETIALEKSIAKNTGVTLNV